MSPAARAKGSKGAAASKRRSVDGASGRVAAVVRIESRNPATGVLLGTLPAATPQQLADLVSETIAVAPLWAQLRIGDRARYLRRAAQAVIDERVELVELLVREGGRPRTEVAALELLGAIDTLRWLAANAESLLGSSRLPLSRALHPFKRASVAHEPAGTVALIGSGSSPFAGPLCQIAAALVAGNGVVFKPAVRASLAGERIVRLLARAGLPEGIVRVAYGGAEVGRELVAAEGVARVFFTGGRRAGAEVALACASAGRGAVIELGGPDAMIVLEDANVPRAVAAALWAGCVGAGQPHGAVKRVLVVRERFERFVAELRAGSQALALGDPIDEDTQLGPLASPARRDALAAAVSEAIAGGAELHCGAPAQPGGLAGAFHTPVVLTQVSAEARLRRERVPGPVIAVCAIADSAEAVELANEGEGGLGASVWCADRYRAERIARELRVGSVWLNDHLPAPGVGRAPWGAVGGGSIWRSQGAAGLAACVEPKLITWDPPPGRSFWWHRYDRTSARAAMAIAEFGSIRDADRERALRGGSLALLRMALRVLRSRGRR